jgi:hypothetical protein
MAVFSLRWPLVHDLPILLYDGFLMQLGRVPYRDFLDVNAPGTMLLHAFLHQLTGGNSLLLRVVDMVVLSSISAATILALRSHGVHAGLLASACFAIAYLATGPVQSLQREYLCVLPLSISLALVLRADGSSSRLRLSVAIAGLLAGMVLTVKPPLALCWAPLVLMAAIRSGRERTNPYRFVRVASAVLFAFLLGLSVVPALVVIWMVGNGALPSYLDVLRNYYPLYSELRGTGFLWSSGTLGFFIQRYVVDTLALFSGFNFAVISFAGLALAWAYRSRPAFGQCLTICGVVACSLAYVSITGKFWIYHSFPLFYALAVMAGLAVSKELASSSGESSWRAGVIAVAFVIGLPLNTLLQDFWSWRAGRTYEVKEGRVDLVANFLERSTKPTETVMALDVTSGAIHGLYRNRRPLYGRFVYDQFFYHHENHPYIRKLRNELIAEFRDGNPQIVVQFDDTWLRSPGDKRFPELEAILENDYELALHENNVSIYRRRSQEGGTASGSASAPSSRAGAIAR